MQFPSYKRLHGYECGYKGDSLYNLLLRPVEQGELEGTPFCLGGSTNMGGRGEGTSALPVDISGELCCVVCFGRMKPEQKIGGRSRFALSSE